jgi:hypothetical protein
MGYLNILSGSYSLKNIQDQVDFILLYKDYFKVCESCDAISLLDTEPICQYCKGYNFNRCPKSVKKQAFKLLDEKYTKTSYIFNYNKLER